MTNVEFLQKKMINPDFWDLFFNCFLVSVHPIEFAVRISLSKYKSKDQKEEALTAALQRTIIQHRTILGLDEWFPAIEAPVDKEHSKSKNWLFSDITLTPWNSDKKACWSAASQQQQQIRIEVKWHDITLLKEKSSSLKEKLKTIESEPQFIITLIFEKQEDDIFNNTCAWINEDLTINTALYKLIYNKKKKRKGYEFETYSHFRLIIHAHS